MTAVHSLLDQGLKSMLAVATDSLIINGVSVRAVITSGQITDEYGMGGHLLKRSITASIRISEISGPALQIGKIVLYGGEKYQVIQINNDGPGVTILASEVAV